MLFRSQVVDLVERMEAEGDEPLAVAVGRLPLEADGDAPLLLCVHGRVPDRKVTASPSKEGCVRAVARAGAGVNNIPVDACTARGIPVFNTPGANANAVKELVAAGMFLASRGIVEGIAYAGALSAELDEVEMNKQLEAEKKRFAGNELRGKTLGVIEIGRAHV